MPLDLPLSPTALKPAAKGMRQPEAGARRDAASAAAAANALGNAEPDAGAAINEAGDTPAAGTRSFAHALRKAQQPQDTDPSPKPGRHGAAEEPDTKAPWGHAWGHWRAPGQQEGVKDGADAELAAPGSDGEAPEPVAGAVDPTPGAVAMDPTSTTQPVLPVLPPTTSLASSEPLAADEISTAPVSSLMQSSASAERLAPGGTTALEGDSTVESASSLPNTDSPALKTGAPMATTITKPIAEGETDSPSDPSAPVTLPLGLDRALDRAAPKAATGLARAAAAVTNAGGGRPEDARGDGVARAGLSASNAAVSLNAAGGTNLTEGSADPLAGAAAGAAPPAANAQTSAASAGPNAGSPTFATWLEHRLQDARSDAAAQPPVEVRVPTPVDDPRFTQNLGVQLATLARDGVSEARLHLHPADMGPISVQIALDGTLAHLDLGASVEQTRQLLEQALPELATALRESGLTLSGGSVSDQARPFPGFGAGGAGGSGDAGGSGAGNGRQDSGGERGRPGDGDLSLDAAARNPERWRRADSLLDTYA